MLIAGIALGLVLGLLAGGNLANLASIRLRLTGLLVVALLLRIGTEFLLEQGVPIVDTLRLPLLAAAFGLLLIALWANRGYPGFPLVFVGILSNAIVIVVNGGYMPIWQPSLAAAGLTPEEVTSAIHTILPPALDANFLLHLGPFGDVIPLPLPPVQNVASIGDLFLTLGLAFFLFAAVVRVPQVELTEEQEAAIRRRLEAAAAPTRRPRSGDAGAQTGLSPSLTASVALQRPLVLGSAGPGLSSPSAEAFAADAGTAIGSAPGTRPGGVAIPVPWPSPEVVERVRQHPYVRLALNGSFSALWAGQLISLFGDRLNQLALVAVVAITTGSALATGLVFFAATLPNMLLSPIAGTFVDRWDKKEVMVVSDILRAAIILVMPVAAVTNIFLVYPLVFLVTSISVFFRPARVAILPRIVPEEDLLSANSALWVGETMADIIGYPLAGLFVALLGSAVPLAFWVDSATYLASAALIGTIVVAARTDTEAADDATARERRPGFFAELKEGWQFLRGETVLLANTVQGAVGQFSIGITIALTGFYVKDTFSDETFGWLAALGFLETGIGLGALVGGFLVGLVGARFAKGRMVIVGYAALGLFIFLFALVGNLGVAFALMFGQGVANMIAIIPSQTLFQERTPAELMGRVVGFRFALVFGSMTVAMLLGSVLGEVFGPSVVIAMFGLVTVAAGLAGLLVPAVRDA
jgi:MFS transporter, DHA3 family, macrolide efflux protein